MGAQTTAPGRDHPSTLAFSLSKSIRASKFEKKMVATKDLNVNRLGFVNLRLRFRGPLPRFPVSDSVVFPRACVVCCSLLLFSTVWSVRPRACHRGHGRRRYYMKMIIMSPSFVHHQDGVLVDGSFPIARLAVVTRSVCSDETQAKGN